MVSAPDLVVLTSPQKSRLFSTIRGVRRSRGRPIGHVCVTLFHGIWQSPKDCVRIVEQ
jgi:hypothetical protein